MMRINLSQLLCILVLLPYSGFISAYEIQTHKRLSEEAYSASDLNNAPNVLANLGLLTSNTFPNSQGGVGRSIIQLIGDGAQFEDTLTAYRPINHFFNPLNGAPLTLLGFSLPNYPSPDWALEDKGPIDGALGFGKQEFSYHDAREYLYKALTLPSQPEREKNFGLTFQALGQVIHHIQDMAQPQHVRNDEHLELKFSTEAVLCVSSPALCAGYLGIKNPSLYEAYTNRPDVRASLPFSGYAPVYSSADTTTFNTPRYFWETPAGQGIAQFTNSNFVSAGTNFDNSGMFNFPLFDPSLRSDLDFHALCLGAKPSCPNPALTGTMTFYGNWVQDRYTGKKALNPLASTSSIFSSDLEKALGKSVFTLNRFNFDVAYGFLIPRAVGYSAGLINYFFRGKMQISLPPEGVYSLIDPSTTPSGFSKIKLVLTNKSPAGEDMVGGQVVAVAKFHRNTCYKSDLSGEIGLPGNDYNTCHSKTEQIVVSAPLPLTLAAGAATPTPLVFDFSSTPIPLSATDLYLQVVYRGKLGQEADAVAVTTLDIAEPTTYDITNMTDYFLLNGTFYKVPSPYDSSTLPSQVDPALFAYIDVNANGIYNPGTDRNLARRSLSYHFDLGGGTALGSMTLPPSSFARFTVLVNNASGPNTVLNLTKETYGYAIARPITPNINQQDPVTGLPSYSTPFLFLGHYVYDTAPDHGFYPATAPIPNTLGVLQNLAPQPISINFPLP